MKIIEIVAAILHNMNMKCTKFDFSWSSAPRYAVRGSQEPTSKRKGRGCEREKRRRIKERELREWEGSYGGIGGLLLGMGMGRDGKWGKGKESGLRKRKGGEEPALPIKIVPASPTGCVILCMTLNAKTGKILLVRL